MYVSCLDFGALQIVLEMTFTATLVCRSRVVDAWSRVPRCNITCHCFLVVVVLDRQGRHVLRAGVYVASSLVLI